MNEYFKDTYPFMRHSIGGELDGNAVSYSSMYAHVLMDKGLHNEARELLWEIYKQSVVIPGYISRGPHKRHDRQSHDDVVHFLTAAKRCGGLEKEINEVYLLLKNNLWFYYVSPPSGVVMLIRSWFFRIPGFVSVVKYAAGVKLNIIEKLWLLFDVLTTTFSPSRSTSGRLMDWAKCRMLRGERGILGLACRIFERDVQHRYKHLMGDVFQIYFQRDPELKQNPIHVFAVMMQNKL